MLRYAAKRRIVPGMSSVAAWRRAPEPTFSRRTFSFVPRFLSNAKREQSYSAIKARFEEAWKETSQKDAAVAARLVMSMIACKDRPPCGQLWYSVSQSIHEVAQESAPFRDSFTQWPHDLTRSLAPALRKELWTLLCQSIVDDAESRRISFESAKALIGMLHPQADVESDATHLDFVRLSLVLRAHARLAATCGRSLPEAAAKLIELYETTGERPHLSDYDPLLALVPACSSEDRMYMKELVAHVEQGRRVAFFLRVVAPYFAWRGLRLLHVRQVRWLLASLVVLLLLYQWEQRMETKTQDDCKKICRRIEEVAPAPASSASLVSALASMPVEDEK